jgi:hypothetical protein
MVGNLFPGRVYAGVSVKDYFSGRVYISKNLLILGFNIKTIPGPTP